MSTDGDTVQDRANGRDKCGVQVKRRLEGLVTRLQRRTARGAATRSPRHSNQALGEDHSRER